VEAIGGHTRWLRITEYSWPRIIGTQGIVEGMSRPIRKDLGDFGGVSRFRAFHRRHLGQVLAKCSVLGFPFTEADISTQNEVEGSITTVSQTDSSPHPDNLIFDGQTGPDVYPLPLPGGHPFDCCFEHTERPRVGPRPTMPGQ